MGARVGVKDHVKIAARSRFATSSDVYADIDEKGDYAGSPAMPLMAFKRQFNTIKNISSILQEVKQSLKKLHEKIS